MLKGLLKGWWVIGMVMGSAYAQEVRWESVITHAGYIQYMAEGTCLTMNSQAGQARKDDLIEDLKSTREAARKVYEVLDPKYGLDVLSSEERNRMVATLKRQPNTNQAVMARISEIMPSCDTALPSHLAKIMPREKFVEYMAEVNCLLHQAPPGVPETTAIELMDKKYGMGLLSDREKNRIANAYLIHPAIYLDVLKRRERLDSQCQLAGA